MALFKRWAPTVIKIFMRRDGIPAQPENIQAPQLYAAFFGN
jgi:hypothetical protein